MSSPENFIQQATVAPEPLIQLLENTLIGTKGSLYQLLNTRQKIHRLDHPTFFYIQRHEKVLGTITICDRNVTLGLQNKNALYIRYFAFDKAFQGNSESAKSKSTLFDKHWKKIFETGNINSELAETKSTFFWAYIDPENLRSFRMNERFGFETIGQFRTIAFSRISPKKSTDLFKLHEDDKPEVLNYVRTFYSGYSFFSDVHLFDKDYYVLKKKGKIVAGIQATPVQFKIHSLPGFAGKFLVKILPHIPLMKRIINPKQHRFLATEGLFWTEGNEKYLEELLSGVLGETKHYSLLIWNDEKSERIKNLKIKKGLLQKLKKDNLINIVAKPVNLSQEELSVLKNSPKYLSGFDMT